jgi:hypothetical protein
MAYCPNARAQAVILQDLKSFGIAFNGQGAFHGQDINMPPALRKLHCAHYEFGFCHGMDLKPGSPHVPISPFIR